MNSNRTNKTQTLVGTSGPLVRSEGYNYDAIDQVAAVAYASNSIPMRNISYQYDPVGNRQQVTEDGNPTGYTANNLNQYTVIGGNNLSYDTKGNLQAQPGWTYTYDAQNRLLTAVSASTSASFVYDTRNRCVARTVNGVATYLTYDGWSLIEECDSRGTLLDKYVHGAATDEMIVRYNGSPVYYHHDGLGSTVALTDNTGALLESCTYDVFGAPSFFDAAGSPLSASALLNRFLFTGRESLAELSLYDYRNRFYGPLLGRFLQTDPIGFEAGDVNLYRYCLDDPVNNIDPLGFRNVFTIIDSIDGGWGSATAADIQRFNKAVEGANSLTDSQGRRCYSVTVNQNPVGLNVMRNSLLTSDLTILAAHGNEYGKRDLGDLSPLDSAISAFANAHGNDVSIHGCHSPYNPKVKIPAYWVIRQISGLLEKLPNTCCETMRTITLLSTF